MQAKQKYVFRTTLILYVSLSASVTVNYDVYSEYAHYHGPLGYLHGLSEPISTETFCLLAVCWHHTISIPQLTPTSSLVFLSLFFSFLFFKVVPSADI